MSRLSRTDAAKSVIEVWRWLHEQSSDQEVEGGTKALWERIGKIGNVPNDNAMNDRIRLIEHLGLIRRETTYEGKPEGGFPRARIVNTLLLDEKEGRKAIAKWFAGGGFLKLGAKGNQRLNGGSIDEPADQVTGAAGTLPKPEVVAIRTDEKDEPVEAIVGEEPPNPFEALRALRKDEPGALVEAARQYANRHDFVFAKLDEIERLGVKIDKAKIMAGIDMARDDELEGVVKILPYVDELEARVRQVEQWRSDVLAVRGEMKELQRAKQKVERELAEQKDANKRLAEKMARDVVSRASEPRVLVG